MQKSSPVSRILGSGVREKCRGEGSVLPPGPPPQPISAANVLLRLVMMGRERTSLRPQQPIPAVNLPLGLAAVGRERSLCLLLFAGPASMKTAGEKTSLRTPLPPIRAVNLPLRLAVVDRGLCASCQCAGPAGMQTAGKENFLYPPTSNPSGEFAAQVGGSRQELRGGTGSSL